MDDILEADSTSTIDTSSVVTRFRLNPDKLTTELTAIMDTVPENPVPSTISVPSGRCQDLILPCSVL